MSDRPSSEIQNALTAEEWAERKAAFYFDGEWARINDEGEMEVKSDPQARFASLDAEHRHAVAALALHEQPFGFTYEDVRRLLREYDLESECDECEVEHRWKRDLAARLAALLPPQP